MRADDLILVIDMQNVYRPDQPWSCGTFDRSCERILTLLRAAETAEAAPQVCFTQFLCDPNATGAWADYNEQYREICAAPWLNEITDTLMPFLARWPLYTKSTYSSLRIPELRSAAARAGRVVLVGVMSECCVLATGMEAIDMGCRVVWLRDACSGADEPREEGVIDILEGLSPPHVQIMDTDAYLRED